MEWFGSQVPHCTFLILISILGFGPKKLSEHSRSRPQGWLQASEHAVLQQLTVKRTYDFFVNYIVGVSWGFCIVSKPNSLARFMGLNHLFLDPKNPRNCIH